MNKQLLKWTLILMSLAGGLALLWAMGSGWNPSRRAIAESRFHVDIRDLKEDEIRSIKLAEASYLVVRPSRHMLEELESLTSHVWDARLPQSADGDSSVFVYSGHGYWCALKHVPREYEKHADWTPVWFGGYVDPCRDSSYDYAGRTVRSRDHTISGFDAEIPPLKVPFYRVRDGWLEIRVLTGDRKQNDG